MSTHRATLAALCALALLGNAQCGVGSSSTTKGKAVDASSSSSSATTTTTSSSTSSTTRWRGGERVRVSVSKAAVVAGLESLGGAAHWLDEMAACLGATGMVVTPELDGRAVAVILPAVTTRKTYVFHAGSVARVPRQRHARRRQQSTREAHPLGHVVNAVEANHPPEFRLNPSRTVVQMTEDQGELQNGDYWACGVSDCNGDVQDLLFKFRNGRPELPNPDPCLVNNGVPRVVPPAPDNDADTYFDRGPLATRRIMNVAPVANCPLPGTGGGVGCGGGGRQWPESPVTGERTPNTCNGIEEPTCYSGNDGGGPCQGCRPEEAQGRYWCKWPDTLQLNPIQPALPNLGGGPRCTGVPQRCPACARAGAPPIVAPASQCNVRCWDDTRSGGAHARLEADPAEDHFGWICWTVSVEDDGLPNVIPGACNCHTECSTLPCDESGGQRACIRIEPVNDCPVFKLRGDASILEDSATCVGSPQPDTCTDVAARGGALGAPGCLLNLGTCCCPTLARGCALRDWIYDINQGAWNEHPYQSVYFDVTTDRPELFEEAAAVPCVEYVPRTGQCGRPSDAAFNAPAFVSRDINFALRPNACGKVRITVVARDDGGESNNGCFVSTTETFELDIRPVNDPPTFEPGPLTGPAVTVGEDAGPYRYPNWAANISPGPGECEKDQMVTFEVDCGAANRNLFSEQPAIDPVTGELTFTPAPNQFTTGLFPNGCVPCRVVLRDNGGTADGGDDTADPPAANTQHWSVGDPWPPRVCIGITSVNDPPDFRPEGEILVCEDEPYNKLWARDICIGGPTPPNPCAVNELAAPENQRYAWSFSAYDAALVSAAAPLALDQNGVLTFTPAAGVSGTSELWVTLTDTGPDDGANENAVSKKTVLTVVAVNDEPNGVLAANPVVVNEGSGRTCVDNFLTDATPGQDEELVQKLTASLLATPTDMFAANPTLEFTSPSTARLCFTLRPGKSGTSNVQLVLTDDGGNVGEHGCGGKDSKTLDFVIEARPVNDPPVLLPGPSVEVCEDSGVHTVPAWAVVAAGPEDERTETVTVTVTNSNPALFASQPTLSPTGTLSYTTLPDAFGEAELTITVTDAQGLSTVHPDAAKGEAPRVIKVAPSNDPPEFTVINDRLTIAKCAVSDPASACKYTSPMPVVGPVTTGPANEAAQRIQSLRVLPDARFASVFQYLPVIDETTRRLTLELVPGQDTGGQYITLTIEATDSGTPSAACGGRNTFTQELLVRVTPDADGRPSFLKGPDVAVVEDSGRYTDTAWAKLIDYGSAPGSSLNPSFSCVPADASLFTAAGVSVDRTSGTLSFTPAPDRYGETEVACTLSNGVNNGAACCATDSFRIVVLPRNDKPTFAASRGSLTVPDLPAEVCVAGFVASSHVGPFEEGTQTLAYSVTPADPDFLVGGADPRSARRARITAAGELCLTPAGKLGTTTLTIRAIDSGGTARQGEDTSDPVDVVLTVTRGNRPPSMVCGGDVEVSEDACVGGTPTAVVRWATGVTAGSDEEDKVQGLSATFDLGGAAGAAKFSVAPSLAVAAPPRGPNRGTPPLTSDTAALRFCPARDFQGAAAVSVYLEDDEGATSAAAPCAFTIRVLPVNDAPLVQIGADVVVSLEDEATGQAGGEKVFAGWGLFGTGEDQGVDPQTLTATVTLLGGAADAAKFAVQPRLVRTGVLGSGTPGVGRVTEVWDLRYKSAADANGGVDARVCVRDSGGRERGGVDETCRDFRINVLPVNDAPTLAPTTLAHAVPEDAGAQVLAKWAAHILVGPAEERGSQAVASLSVGFDNAHNRQAFQGWAGVGGASSAEIGALFFSALPAVSQTTGDLTFQTAPDVFGTIQMDVTVRDNGGTANGGKDATTYPVMLTVAPVNDVPTFAPSAISPIAAVEDVGYYELTFATAVSRGNSFEDHPGLSGRGTLAFTVVTTPTPPNDHGVSTAEVFEVMPAVTPSGVLSFTVRPDMYGTFDLSATLSDGQLSSPPVVARLEIQPVNDAPSFSLSKTLVTVRQPAAGTAPTSPSQPATPHSERVVALVAAPPATQAPSVGPPNEAGQQLSYAVTPLSDADAALFKGGAAGVTVAADGTLSFEVLPRVFGEARFRVEARDDGGTAAGGRDASAPQLLTIRVERDSAAPYFALKTESVTVDEDAGDVVLADHVYDVLQGQPTAPGQVGSSDVVFTAHIDNPNLVEGGVVRVSTFTESGGSSGTNTRHVRFRTKRDQHGEATVTLTATDATAAAGGGGAGALKLSRTFRLRILPINDPPSFSIDGARSVVSSQEDGGAFFVLGFARDVRAGPPNEAAQALAFEVSCVPADLFAVAPTVSASNGQLSYTSAPDRNGAAACSLLLKDDGGCPTCVGLASEPRAFSIDVAAVNDPPTFAAAPLTVAVPNYGDLTAFALPWATNVSAGPPDETLGDASRQTAAVELTVATAGAPPQADVLAMFSGGMLPAVEVRGALGTLRMTPGRLASGEGLFVAQAVDSAGGRSQSTLLLRVLVVPVDNGGVGARDNPVVVDANPSVEVGLTVPASRLRTDGYQETWLARLAARLNKGRGELQVTAVQDTPAGANVRLSLLGDVALHGTNALMDLVHNPEKAAVREELHLRGDLAYAPAGTAPATAAPGAGGVNCTAHMFESTCPAPQCVWSAVGRSCVAGAGGTPPVEGGGGSSSSGLGTGAIIAIIAAATALLIAAAVAGYYLLTKQSRKEDEAARNGKGEPERNSDVVTSSDGWQNAPRQQQGDPDLASGRNPLNEVFPQYHEGGMGHQAVY